jgi:hypothetical protein
MTEFPSWVPRWDTNDDVTAFLHSRSLFEWENGENHSLPTMVNFHPEEGKVELNGIPLRFH